MNIQINSTNIEITDKIKEIIKLKFTSKLDKLLIKFNDEIKTANLHMERDKYGKYTFTFDIQLPGKGGQIYSKNSHDDLVATLTGLREQIEKQIKKYKDDQVNYSLG